MGRCFIVLGMHRSATSLIAKGLVQAGVNMGDVLMQADAANPHGYWEDTEFVNLNKAILAAAGGDWLNIPPEKNILALNKDKEITRWIKKIVGKKNKVPLWGWKDPRTTLTIKLFRPFLPEHFFFVCFRNPADVAASLHIRNNLLPEVGIKIAQEYNRRLLNFLSKTQQQWKFK